MQMKPSKKLQINFARGRKFNYDTMLFNIAEKSIGGQKQRKYYAHEVEGGQ